MEDIEKIYNNYSKIVYKYLFCLTHDYHISEELTQETFYIAIKNISKFENRCKVHVWLCQIAKNLWNKELNKRKKFVITPIDESLEDIQIKDDFIENIILTEEKKYLYEKIEQLGSPLSELVKLRIIMNFSFQEIGEFLNKSEVWARVNFYRAKQKIKEGEKNEIL